MDSCNLIRPSGATLSIYTQSLRSVADGKRPRVILWCQGRKFSLSNPEFVNTYGGRLIEAISHPWKRTRHQVDSAGKAESSCGMSALRLSMRFCQTMVRATQRARCILVSLSSDTSVIANSGCSVLVSHLMPR